MPNFTLPRPVRLTRTHKVSAALVATAGCAAALAFTAAPGNAATTTAANAPAAVKPVSANGMPLTAKDRADDGKQARAVASSVAAGLKVAPAEKQSHAAEQAANRSIERKALVAPKAAPRPPPRPRRPRRPPRSATRTTLTAGSVSRSTS